MKKSNKQQIPLSSILNTAIKEKRIEFIYSYRNDKNNTFIILANDEVLTSTGIDEKAFLLEAKTDNFKLSVIEAEEWFDITSEWSNSDDNYFCFDKNSLIHILPEISRIITTYEER